MDEVAAEGIPSGCSNLSLGKGSHDISLIEIARWGRSYLIHNVVVEHDYRARFQLNLLEYPIGTRYCVWDTGDIDARMEWAFQYTHEMTGSDEGLDIEEGLRKRVFSYIRDDGLSRIPYPDTGDMTGVLGKEDDFSFTWTTGHALVSAAERYRLTGDPKMKALGQKILKGLKNLATWSGKRAYFTGGHGFYQDGKWYGINDKALGRFIDMHHCVTGPVARYFEIMQDEEALEFTVALARGIVEDAMPGLNNGFTSDGSFWGHTHFHTNAIWGVAYVGALTQDSIFIEYAQRVYEFVRSKGCDLGWFPEIIPEFRPEIRPHSEICIVADMADIAACLARAGLTHYWDHVERYVRNAIREMQFFITPEFEEIYCSIHYDKPDRGKIGLKQARQLQGGFVSLYPLNDQMMEMDKTWQLQNLKDGQKRTTGEVTLEYNMGGCCPPSAIRTLHLAWSNVVEEKETGVFINLSFNRDVPQAKVISSLPETGCLTVKVRKEKDFFIRPPSWVPKDKVKSYRNGRTVEVIWSDNYIKFNDTKCGEKIAITYPLLSFTQRIEVGDDPRKEKFTIRWLGNTVMEVEPKGRYMPIFTRVPRPLPTYSPLT